MPTAIRPKLDLSSADTRKKTNASNAGPTNGVLANEATHPEATNLTLNTKAQNGDVSTSQTGSTKNKQTTQNNDNTDTSGEPISLVTGEELLMLTDVTLDGPVPLTWTRTYRTTNPDDIGLGHGWTHSLSEWLVIDSDQQQLQLHLL